jgi:hypothetical protein
MARAISDIIGYQLVSRTYGLHSEIKDKTSVYSLMQVQNMLLNTDGQKRESFDIIRIYKGQIIEPKIMFRGSPFTSDGF